MIVSFRCAETEKIFNRRKSRRFAQIERVALRRLRILDAALHLSDLAGAGMSLEALRGDRAGQYSIRVNDKYRICFVWSGHDAHAVEIVDYH